MTTGKTVLESVIPAVSKSNGDYYGKDGLLYCGKCHTPKEAFFAKNFVLMGKNRHPVDCRCRKMEREQQEVAIRQQKHSELVRRLKAGGFSDTAMLDWNFENDDGRAPQMHYAHRYVEQWQTMRAENLGLLLWGGVGTADLSIQSGNGPESYHPVHRRYADAKAQALPSGRPVFYPQQNALRPIS